MFAECILSDTRQTSSLLSAALKTLGKKKHSVKRRFAECQKKHSAKRRFAECQKKHSAKRGFAEYKKNTRQRRGLPSVFFFALGKEVKYFFWESKRRKKFKKKTLSSAQI